MVESGDVGADGVDIESAAGLAGDDGRGGNYVRERVGGEGDAVDGIVTFAPEEREHAVEFSRTAKRVERLVAGRTGHGDGGAAKGFEPEDGKFRVARAGVFAGVNSVDGDALDPVGREGIESAA